jgi:hypothetical protein
MTVEPSPSAAHGAGITLRNYLYGAGEKLRKRGKAELDTADWPDGRRLLTSAALVAEVLDLMDRLLADEDVFA